jgi:hypothetical protein
MKRSGLLGIFFMCGLVGCGGSSSSDTSTNSVSANNGEHACLTSYSDAYNMILNDAHAMNVSSPPAPMSLDYYNMLTQLNNACKSFEENHSQSECATLNSGAVMGECDQVKNVLDQQNAEGVPANAHTLKN